MGIMTNKIILGSWAYLLAHSIIWVCRGLEVVR